MITNLQIPFLGKISNSPLLKDNCFTKLFTSQNSELQHSLHFLLFRCVCFDNPHPLKKRNLYKIYWHIHYVLLYQVVHSMVHNLLSFSEDDNNVSSYSNIIIFCLWWLLSPHRNNIILQIFYNHSAHFSTYNTPTGVCSYFSVSGKCQLDNDNYKCDIEVISGSIIVIQNSMRIAHHVWNPQLLSSNTSMTAQFSLFWEWC